MRIAIDREDSRITVAAEEVARFARTKRNTHQRIVYSEGGEPSREANVRRSLSCNVVRGAVNFTLSGCADLLWQARGCWTIEKIRERGMITARTSPANDAAFLAECVLSAHMLAEEKGLPGVNVRMT